MDNNYILVELEKKLHKINEDIFSFKSRFLNILNISFDLNNKDYNSILSISKKNNIINLQITDIHHKHFFTNNPIVLINFFISEDLKFEIKQDFDTKINLQSIKIYHYLLNCFSNLNTENFLFNDMFNELSELISSKKEVINNIKNKKLNLQKNKFFSIKNKIDTVFVPISQDQTEIMYNKIINQERLIFKTNIFFCEPCENYEFLIYKNQCIEIDRTRRNIAINIYNKELDRRRKISKNQLKELISKQFNFDNKVVTNTNQLKGIFNNLTSNVVINKSDEYIFKIEDVYKILSAYIKANVF